jgi:hypothetical protein
MPCRKLSKEETGALYMGLQVLELGVAAIRLKRLQKRRIHRRFAVKPSHVGRQSSQMATYQRYRMDDQDMHNYVRMTTAQFDYLLGRIGRRIDRFPTHRYPISSEQRLVITLRFVFFSVFTVHLFLVSS